ncbi:hypothetical protein PHLGIDRAFT_363711 [Phlebiopsis gigantea 11061_1 CR5-6]|uniref:GYF domain-containing protein n=1 Tax=Phlebiopsis gigantea (strain 11061_1 CR5-6) TaxID=745531 RepID=A0A0C3S137_PHLG1|nr:hypothetical protein PHLGIDRAFT_363711 [Phlebiopsis gigantea 11061_1 CR5-6]
MPPRPATKRAGSSDVGPSQPKKTRFVEPADDPANFAEEVDAALENPSARRKGRVRTEGYDSDSSDEGESVVRSRRRGKDKDGAGTGDDDDDDMFAAEDKEEKEEEDGGKKKKEKFMRLGDIEGQWFGEQTRADEDSESEGEPVDEDEAEKRKKAGMGFELTSFHMREEMEEGKFSEDGMYVRAFDPHAVHDKWMDGMDEREIKKARRQHRHMERIQKEKQAAEEREIEQLGGKGEMEKALLPLLKKGETVLEALQRLGAKAKKNGPQKKKPNNKTKRVSEDVPMGSEASEKPKTGPSEIDHITHLASTIMSLGDTDIYSKTYEELVRAVRQSGAVAEDWQPPSADIKYEYKWDVPGATAQEGQVFGPYSEEEMQTWHKAQYFGVAGEKIKVRRPGGDWGSWDDIVT